MLTNPPLVPSNDALRVLRQFAFAGSTLAVATAGVVAVNYNVHRRIRLAEHCLETKRQIRALSNGTGKKVLARVIEAAENGQDFSIQAMREHKTREKRFQPTHFGRYTDKSTEQQQSECVALPHDEVGRYNGREKTVQKIRRATVGITSTAPAHVYGRPNRYTKPTASWPTIGPSELEKLEDRTLLEGAGPTRANAEAAEKIKTATMAMISTTPAHIYGRPEQAVPKARPNLHGAVASWLETSRSPNRKEMASTLKEKLPDGASAEGISKKENRDMPWVTEKSKDPAGEAPGKLDWDAAKSGTSMGRLIAASSHQDMVTDIRPSTGRHMSESSQSLSDKGTEAGVRSPLQEGDKSPISTAQSALATDLALGPSAVGMDSSTRGLIDTVSAASTVSARTDGVADVHLNVVDSEVVLPGHDSQMFDVSKLAASVKDRVVEVLPAKDQVAEVSLASQEIPAVALRAHHTEERYGHRSKTADPITPEVRLKRSGTGADDVSPSSPPTNHIQLEYEVNQGESSFRSWPHLHPLAESDFVLEQQQFDSHDLEETLEKERAVTPVDPSEYKFDEGTQVRHMWTPFARSSPPDPQEETGKSIEGLGELTRANTAIDILTAEARAGLALDIQKVLVSDGSTAGQKAWITAADSRIRHNDLIALDFLYAEFIGSRVLSISSRHQIVQTLVQWHYQRNKSSARSAEILFPDPENRSANLAACQTHSHPKYVSSVEEGRLRFRFVFPFLEGLWEMRPEPAWLVLNLRRIIVAAKLRGVQLIEDLFGRVIRFLGSVGEMGTAQAVYDEMIYYHQIQSSFRSQTLLLHGYARLSDWPRVEREIESLHQQGFSRSSPHGYALMIDAVLQEYATRTSADQFQNFLIIAISYWGLVPTSSISTTAVRVFLSHKRYDLVREWMETLQVLFPQLETETTLFQWAIAHSWQRTGATCQDIEQTIKAVAYRNPRTKLKSYAVPLIHEALSRDLAAKLSAAKPHTAHTLPSSFPPHDKDQRQSISSPTLDEYLSSAYSLTAAHVSHAQPPTPEIIHLHRQATAADRVNAFLHGTPSSDAVDRICFPSGDAADSPINSHMDLDTAMDRTPTAAVPLTYSVAHLKGIVPDLLTADVLPDPSLISDLVVDLYRNMYRNNNPSSSSSSSSFPSSYHRPSPAPSPPSDHHILLLWVCEKLVHAGRAFDAVRVLRAVYRELVVKNSISVACGADGLRNHGGSSGGSGGGDDRQACGFPMEFFEFWMQLAWLTRSLVQWKGVVEEVLHLSRPVWRRGGLLLVDGDEEVGEEGGMRGWRGGGGGGGGAGLQITASFVYLTRFVAARGLRGRWTRLRPGPELDGRRVSLGEVIWLVHELEERREEQIGRWDGAVGRRFKRSKLRRKGAVSMR